MTKIIGVDDITIGDLREGISQGGKFVMFQYCFSILIMTFKRPTSIYYIAPGEGTFGKSWPFSLISFLFGWWGIPWGFIYTPWALIMNLRGGKDVTQEILQFLEQQAIAGQDIGEPEGPQINLDEK